MQTEFQAQLQAQQEASEAKWQAEREMMQRQFQQAQEAERQKLDMALQYMQTLGSVMGLSPPPPFTASPFPYHAATPTPVSDFTFF